MLYICGLSSYILHRHVFVNDEEELPDDLVYVDELQMTQQERKQNRQFRKKDQYHLPNLDMSLEEMGAPDDPRVMSHEELEEYAQQFHSGEDINLYDFSKIDFGSPFFLSLPASDRYNILNAARLRSRLRMGYSKDQLDTMFPDRMAFSRFQVERVKERNDLTQRLMNINGMNGEDGMYGLDGGGRVAGEKGKEYVLVKNDGVEGGWALGVLSSKDTGERNKPINVEDSVRAVKVEETDEQGDDDEGFEDVPIEGLNRLPKRRNDQLVSESDGTKYHKTASHRRAAHNIREQNTEIDEPTLSVPAEEESESLFVGPDQDSPSDHLNGQPSAALADDNWIPLDDMDQDLDRAIAMSLEDHDPVTGSPKRLSAGSPFPEHGDPGQSKVSIQSDRDDSDSDMDLQAALAESRRSKHKSQHRNRVHQQQSREDQLRGAKDHSASLYDGPLPFEKLDLKQPVATSTQEPPVDNDAGGFEKPSEQTPKALPLPPWFAAGAKGPTESLTVGSETNFARDRPVKNDLDSGSQHIIPKQDAEDVISVSSSDDENKQVTETAVAHSTHSERHAPMEDSATSTEVHQDEALPQDNTSNLVHLLHAQSIGSEDEQAELVEWEDIHPDAASPSALVDLEQHDQTMKGVAEKGTQKGPLSTDSTGVDSLNDAAETAKVQTVMEDENDAISQVADESGDVIADEDIEDYSDPEEEELLKHLTVEAEEHARFASSLNHKSQLQNQEDYERELRTLRNQQKKDRRDADEVNQIMIAECQQLLKLFGLPYITAPMEAEAQCAELVRLGLVDGIVTDDSDCFLFGGTRVYKNMFNQAKFVECYLASDLEKEFDLDRHKLIGIAHLLGSDYTEGIPGIGPVTALEILSDFNSPTGLEDFKSWWQGVQIGMSFPEDARSPFRKKFVCETHNFLALHITD